jgi:hypothetical protein
MRPNAPHGTCGTCSRLRTRTHTLRRARAHAARTPRRTAHVRGQLSLRPRTTRRVPRARARQVLLVEHGKVYKNEVKVLREAVAAAAAYGVEEEVRALAAVAEEPPSASGSVKRERGAKRELGDTALKSEEMTATVKQERAVRVKREI